MTKQLQSLETTTAVEQTDTPPVNRHLEAAARVSAAIASSVAEIKPLAAPHPLTVPFVRANAAVGLDFIVSVVGAIEGVPELQNLALKFDLPAAHDTLEFIQAFGPVADQLEELLRALRFTIASRKAVLGSESLKVYKVAQAYAVDRGSALSTRVGIMRRTLGRTRGSKKPQPPAPQTETEKDGGKEEAKV